MAQQDMNDKPVGELVQELSRQTATLVRQELQLAQLEMKEKGKRAGVRPGCAPERVRLEGGPPPARRGSGRDLRGRQGHAGP